MAKTYAETPTSVSTFTGAELVVVQTGSTPAPQGFSEMKKTTLQDIKGFMTKDLSGKADKTYVDTELQNKADKSDTYTKTEVDTLVDGATPNDYEGVKEKLALAERTNRQQNFRIENLESKLDHLDYTEDTTDGSLDLPLVDLAPFAMVEGVYGKSEQTTSEEKSKTDVETTVSTFSEVAEGDDGAIVPCLTVKGVSRVVDGVIRSTGGSAKVVGKNLWSYASSSNAVHYINEAGVPLKANTYYTVSFNASTDRANSILYIVANVQNLADMSADNTYYENIPLVVGRNSVTIQTNRYSSNFFVLRQTAGNEFTEIQIEEGTEATAYEPYTETSFTMPTLRSAGNVADEWKDGKVTRYVGEVDLGTLSWKRLSSGVFYSSFTGHKRWDYISMDTNNGMSDRYLPVLASAISSTDKSFSFTNDSDNLYISDSSYSTTDEFKTAMTGVMLHYELATPSAPVDAPMPNLHSPSTTIMAEEVFTAEWKTPASPSPSFPRKIRDVVEADVKSVSSDDSVLSAITITPPVPLRSVGDVRDELIFNEDGTSTLIQRVGIVKKSPSRIQSGMYFYLTVDSHAKVKGYAVSDKFNDTERGYATEMCVALTEDAITLRSDAWNPNHDKTINDVGEVKCIYELATPSTINFTEAETSAILHGADPYLMVQKGGSISIDSTESKADARVKFSTKKEVSA